MNQRSLKEMLTQMGTEQQQPMVAQGGAQFPVASLPPVAPPPSGDSGGGGSGGGMGGMGEMLGMIMAMFA